MSFQATEACFLNAVILVARASLDVHGSIHFYVSASRTRLRVFAANGDVAHYGGVPVGFLLMAAPGIPSVHSPCSHRLQIPAQADVTVLRCPVADCRRGFDASVLRELLGGPCM